MEQSSDYNVTIKIRHKTEEEIVEGEPRIEIIVGLEPKQGGDVPASPPENREVIAGPAVGRAGSSGVKIAVVKPMQQGAGGSGVGEPATQAGSSGIHQQAGGADPPATGNNVVRMTMSMRRKRARALLPWEARRQRRCGRGTFWPFNDE